VKVTGPAGDRAPLVACTVAVSTAEPFGRIVEGLTFSAVMVAATGMPAQAVTRL
jgi:hypothetical protein